MPARGFGDNQVLRLADHGHDAAERGPDAGVHHQAAQKAAELLQHLTVVLLDMAVIEQVAIVRARRGDAVIDAVEPDGDADHYRHHRQRIEKGREEGGRQAERQR